MSPLPSSYCFYLQKRFIYGEDDFGFFKVLLTVLKLGPALLLCSEAGVLCVETAR